MSCTDSASMLVIASVPLMSASPSLGSTSTGVSPCARSGFAALDPSTAALRNPPLTEQHGRDGRQRRQVARRTERSVFGHPGDDARREQPEERFDELDADSGQTGRQRPRAQQDHSADHLVVEASAGSRGVAEDDRPLEQRAVGGIDGAIRKRPEPGGHAVDGGALPVETVHHLARRTACGHEPLDRGSTASR